MSIAALLRQGGAQAAAALGEARGRPRAPRDCDGGPASPREVPSVPACVAENGDEQGQVARETAQAALRKLTGSEIGGEIALGPGAARLAVEVARGLEGDEQSTLDALFWLSLDVLGPLCSRRLRLLGSAQDEQLIEAQLLLALALKVEPSLGNGEGVTAALADSRDFLQSLGGLRAAQPDPLHAEVLRRALVDAGEARMLLYCAAAARVVKAAAGSSAAVVDNLPNLDEALSVEAAATRDGVDLEALETEHWRRLFRRVQGSLPDWAPVAGEAVDAVRLGPQAEIKLAPAAAGRVQVVCVSGLTRDADAAMRVRPGDVLVCVDQHPVADVATAERLLSRRRGTSALVYLWLQRPGEEGAAEEFASRLWARWGLVNDESVLHVSRCEARAPGELFVTSYRLIFQPDEGAARDSWHVPLLCLGRIDHKACAVSVVTKDLRTLSMQFSSAKMAEKAVRQTTALLRHDPLKRAAQLARLPDDLGGWAVYDARLEYERMGLALFPGLELFEQPEYALCPTYPRVLVLPAGSTKHDRNACARFRSLGRLPVVTWVNCRTGAVLARCAQPLTGLRNVSSAADESIVAALMTAARGEGTPPPLHPPPPRARTGPSASTGLASSPTLSPQREGVGHFVSDMWSRVNNFMKEEAEQAAARGPLAKDGGAGEKGSGGGGGGGGGDANGGSGGGGASGSGGGASGGDGEGREFEYVIMDARSQIASMGNQMLGKGTENPANYPGARLQFHSIDNIHAVRGAFVRLHKLVDADPGDFLKALTDTGWLRQVQSVLEASLALARTLELDGKSALTHCSDGWDRTSQMCALAMLFLDPYYRTRRGFAVLVEKEWCSFGHKFKDRVGNEALKGRQHSEERSPVFTLWVDCVWQTMVQYPAAFEFNEAFLVALLDHHTSGRFGTFLYNSERERLKEHRAHERTGSVWTELLAREDLVNAEYAPDGVILPRASSRFVRLWETYYLRFDRDHCCFAPTRTPRLRLNYA